MIIHPQWSFELKLKLLVSVISQNKTVSEVCQTHHIAKNEFYGWLKEIFKDVPPVDYVINVDELNVNVGESFNNSESDSQLRRTVNANTLPVSSTYHGAHNQIFIKDKNHCFIGFNKLAMVAGSKNKLEACLGLDDYACTPEYADVYVEVGEKVMKSQQYALSNEAPVYCEFMGWINAEAQIFPILDDNGDAASIVIAQKIDYKISARPFYQVVKAIYSGFAGLFIQRSHYAINLPSLVSAVKFSRRETECLLYLLVGLPLKRISHFMSISLKTVEKMITSMNLRVGVSTKTELIFLLERNAFFKDFGDF